MKSFAFPLPGGLQFRQWSSVVAEQLAEYGVTAPTEDIAWKEWACSLLAIPELAFIPSPLEFPAWDAWAERVLETN